MIVTVCVPDNTVKMMLVEINDGWESDPRPITLGEIIKLEADNERHPDH